MVGKCAGRKSVENKFKNGLLPTGQVLNPTTDFKLLNGNTARFIFVGVDAVISGWNGGTAVVLFNNKSCFLSETAFIILNQNNFTLLLIDARIPTCLYFFPFVPLQYKPYGNDIPHKSWRENFLLPPVKGWNNYGLKKMYCS